MSARTDTDSAISAARLYWEDRLPVLDAANSEEVRTGFRSLRK